MALPATARSRSIAPFAHDKIPRLQIWSARRRSAASLRTSLHSGQEVISKSRADVQVRVFECTLGDLGH